MKNLHLDSLVYYDHKCVSNCQVDINKYFKSGHEKINQKN